MSPLIVALPGNGAVADTLALLTGGERGGLEIRQFPDGESYLRLVNDPRGRDVVLVCTLSRPNDKLLDLLFAAAAARELGALKIGLVAPYLAYMRQDRRFQPGEAVTSKEVARLMSGAFDWLVTVDPHLHRYASLSEIYSIPARVVYAAPLIAAWIKANVADPMLIGPDSESEQWVSAVARDAGAPFTVLRKTRRGDRSVEISVGNISVFEQRTPVLVDDIISSARTMLEVLRQIGRRRAAPVCIAVHGVFADRSDQALIAAGAQVITCNTIVHSSNAIDVMPAVARSIVHFIG